MNLSSIAINDLRRRKAKMIFLLVGMVIGISTIVALYTVTREMEKEIANKFDEIGSNMTIVPKSDDMPLSYGGVSVSELSFDVKELDMSAIDKIRTIKNKENIATIAPKLLGTTQVDSKEMLLMGVDFKAELRMKKWWKIQGAKPLGPGEVLLGAEAAAKLGKQPGSTLKVKGLSANEETFKVAGVIESVGSQEDGVIYMSLPAVQKILGKPNALSFIEVSALCYTCPIEEIVAQLSEKLPDTKVTAILEAIKARQEVVDRFAKMAYGVSAIVLLIGTLVVFITMMSSVSERTREIGIFRAIGFRKAHVMQVILFQAAILSIIGGIIGYFAGMGAATLLAPAINQVSISIQWDPMVGLLAVGIALLTGLLASLLPAFKAARLDPVEALRFI